MCNVLLIVRKAGGRVTDRAVDGWTETVLEGDEARSPTGGVVGLKAARSAEMSERKT
jgi:hypothetical protein